MHAGRAEEQVRLRGRAEPAELALVGRRAAVGRVGAADHVVVLGAVRVEAQHALLLGAGAGRGCRRQGEQGEEGHAPHGEGRARGHGDGGGGS